MKGSRDKDGAKPSQMVNGWEVKGKKLMTKEDLSSYLKSVKELLKDNKEKYDQFIDVMKDLKTKRIDPTEVIARVKDVFSEHPDLITGFNSFLPKEYEITDLKPVQQPAEFESAINFVNKIKVALAPSDDYQEFLNSIQMYSKGEITQFELKKLVSDLFSAHPHDLIDGFDEFLSSCEKINGFVVEMKVSKSNIRAEEEEIRCQIEQGKYAGKPTHQLDFSNCEISTPSYRHLPKDYPIPLTSHRTKIGDEVLNDHWVSIANAETAEGYTYKPRPKTLYEEKLFGCENDRFETDLLVEIADETITCVEEILENVKGKNMVVFGVVEYFTNRNRTCIERVYAEYGLDVLDVLKKNGTSVLPILLTRLKQKRKEWSKHRTVLNQVCTVIHSNNRRKTVKNKIGKK